ncbi:MAG: D-alanine--D-alanine ligase [Bradymonadales bacterium]|nr:MAG: D-alanine--D-alanine ligase [Bradymonadales bacterium]
MKSLALLCGGPSGEHEISLISAKHFVRAMKRELYDLRIIWWDRDGVFRLVSEDRLAAISDQPDQSLDLGGQPLRFEKAGIRLKESSIPIDLAFPLLHGTGGEDGRIQGFLETLGIPFVGAGLRASVLGMDKALTKLMAQRRGVNVIPFELVRQGARLAAPKNLPCFVKPSGSGSSLGVSLVKSEKDWEEALKEAWKQGPVAMVEPKVVGREIEIALLDDGQNRIASPGGEIRCTDFEFYSYDAKYVSSKGVDLIAPADLTDEQARSLESAAWSVFDSIGCQALARVDFFLTESGELLLNEINTMPGFTPISMYPRLMQLAGVPYSELIERLLNSIQIPKSA